MFGLFQTPATPEEKFPVMKTDAQWKAQLPPAAYQVLRKAGTERPYSSPLNEEHRKGVFYCLGCANPLYSSDTKFDSHTGWPSFWQPIAAGAIKKRVDNSMILEIRTEVLCAKCGGHQGHVFNDGPKPTGLRYCMNGASMGFKAA
jgi:peptide-methionine (R)-S-oxide reductase